jgi:hypothetical protein
MYDENKEMFGVYSYSEGYSNYEVLAPIDFFDNSYRANSLMAIENIDFDQVIEMELPWGEYDYDFSSASTGRYAIAYKSSFLTDFIYGYDFWRHTIDRNDVIVVHLNDSYGVLNASGDTMIPFVFNDIVLIDNETAFAKYNGKYGILDLQETTALLTSQQE